MVKPPEDENRINTAPGYPRGPRRVDLNDAQGRDKRNDLADALIPLLDDETLTPQEVSNYMMKNFIPMSLKDRIPEKYHYLLK